MSTLPPTLSYNNADGHRAGFFPGAVYLCTFWYMPKDLASRLAFFYCASSISGAFSGLLAAAIAQMNGVGGYAGWRWIFIIEGLATIVLGIFSFFLLIDSPRLSTRWLDEEEIRFLELQRIVKEGGVSREEEGEQKKFRWHDLGGVLATWRLYVQAFFLFCQSACSYGEYLTQDLSCLWTSNIKTRNEIYHALDHQGNGL